MNGKSAEGRAAVAVWGSKERPLVSEGLCSAFSSALFPVEVVRYFDFFEPLIALDAYRAVVVEVNAETELKIALDLISKVRDQYTDIAILALVKKLTIEARVSLFLAGSDCCTTLPVRVDELARAFASLISAIGCNDAPTLDVHQLCLWSQSDQVTLTYDELNVLASLNCARGRIASRDEMVALLGWNPDGYDQRALEKFISRLRAKVKRMLGANAIQSVRGYGYRLSRRLAVVGG